MTFVSFPSPLHYNRPHLPVVLTLLVWGLLGTLAHAQHPTAVTSIVNSEQDTTLEVNHAGGLLVPGKFAELSYYSAPNDSIPATGAGTRLMWYTAKAAFRAGRVGWAPSKSDVWDADSIGNYSVAFGADTKASGDVATAMGASTTASGDGATAMGTSTTASGFRTTAMGFRTTASGIYATAMGYESNASGATATAMGFFTTAATDESMSIGQYNSANTSADNSLFVAGNGSYGSRSDALVLKQDGDLATVPRTRRTSACT